MSCFLLCGCGARNESSLLGVLGIGRAAPDKPTSSGLQQYSHQRGQTQVEGQTEPSNASAMSPAEAQNSIPYTVNFVLQANVQPTASSTSVPKASMPTVTNSVGTAHTTTVTPAVKRAVGSTSETAGIAVTQAAPGTVKMDASATPTVTPAENAFVAEEEKPLYLKDAVQEASLLQKLREQVPDALALQYRIDIDVKEALRIMRAYGYYAGRVTVQGMPDVLPLSAPASTVPVSDDGSGPMASESAAGNAAPTGLSSESGDTFTSASPAAATASGAHAARQITLVLGYGPRYTIGSSTIYYQGAAPATPLASSPGTSSTAFPPAPSSFAPGLTPPHPVLPVTLDAAGLAPGSPAVAATVLDAVDNVPLLLSRRGYPLSKVLGTRYVVDHAQRQLGVAVLVDAGPEVRMGRVRMETEGVEQESAADDPANDSFQDSHANSFQNSTEDSMHDGNADSSHDSSASGNASPAVRTGRPAGKDDAADQLSGTPAVSSVKLQYLQRLSTWFGDQIWDQDRVDEFQDILTRQGLFRSIRMRPVPAPAPVPETDGQAEAGTMPKENDKLFAAPHGAAGQNGLAKLPVYDLMVTVADAPQRTLGGGLFYDSDRGIGAEASWEHRNYWGQGELLRGEAQIWQDTQYARVLFRKPAFGRRGQDLTTEAWLRNEDTNAYTQQAAWVSAAVQRKWGKSWTSSLGIALEAGELKDPLHERKGYSMASLPLSLRYNSTGSTLDSVRGVRLGLSVSPSVGWYDEDFCILPTRVDAAYYLPLGKLKEGGQRLVLAFRAAGGSLWREDAQSVPAAARYYGGGGGSVRGYAYQSLGPRDKNSDPLGGASFVEMSAEARIRLTKDISLVPFVDGGNVYPGSTPALFSDGVQWGGGLGLRYHTPVGPMRLDVATPLNPRHNDGPVFVYISIGQSF